MALTPGRLRVLDVFARTGTVRATAAELHLSPSSVSEQLAALEGETGLVLFERLGRRLVLTPTGELLVDRARDVLEHLDAVESELTDLATEPAGPVRIGGFASSIAPILLPAARDLAASSPLLQLEVREIEPREAVVALHQGILDLVVTVDEGDAALLDPTLTVLPLASDPLMAVLPAGHRVVDAARVSLADLAAEPWALDHEGTYLGELVPRECRRAGFEPRVVGRIASYGVLLAHVAAGMSVAVLPELAVDPGAGVVARPIAGLADRRIVIALRSGAARRRALRAVVDAVRATVETPS